MLINLATSRRVRSRRVEHRGGIKAGHQLGQTPASPATARPPCDLSNTAMSGYQRTVGVLVLMGNVLLTITQAQWLYQYPSPTHNWRRKIPQYTYHSSDRSYQTSRYPSNQPVGSIESVQSSAQFPVQMHQTPYYSRQQLVKLQNPATYPTQQPTRLWQPSEHPIQQPAMLQQPANHLTPKSVLSQEPTHNTTRWPVKSQQPAYGPSEQPGWSQQHAHHTLQQPVRSKQPTHHYTTEPVTSQQPTHHPTQQPIRSQQPTNHSSQQPIRSQQQRQYPSQQLIWSQQPTHYPTQQPMHPPTQQPIRPQKPIHHLTQQFIRSQQPRRHLTQQSIRSQQPTRHLTQQSTRSQQPTHHLTQQSIRSQQPTRHLTQQSIRSQQPTHHLTQQSIRSQQPTRHLTQQSTRPQQPARHLTQQSTRSQKPTRHLTQQSTRSQQPTHHITQQSTRPQRPTHHLTQQSIKSQQPTRHPTQQSTRSQQPTHHSTQQSTRLQQPTHHSTQQSIRSQQPKHASQQPIKPEKPAHHAHQLPVKSYQPSHPPPQQNVRSQQPVHHLPQKPQYHHTQAFDRRHQPAQYWHLYGNRYPLQRPQSTQAPHRPGHEKERFDTGQVLLTNPNTRITDSTSSPTTPISTQISTSKTLSTNAPIIPTNSVTNSEKTITTNLSTTASTTQRTITSTFNTTFNIESKPDTTTPPVSITSTSPLTTEITTVKIPVPTKIATTSFLPTNTITTSKPTLSVKGKVDDLENAFTTYNTTTIPPAVTDTNTSTTTKTFSPWPFTMKPVQLIVKTHARVSSPKSLLINNTKDLSYHINGNMGGKFEEESLEELSNPSNLQISLNVSQKVCCEIKYREHLPVEESHNVTELTDVLTTHLPLKTSEDHGSDRTDDIPLYNHDLLSQENIATTPYPTEKAVTLLPEDNNTTHLDHVKDTTISLPSLSASPHGEYNASPPPSTGDGRLLSKNNVTFPQSRTETDILLPSELLTDDTSTSPVEETIPISPARQSYRSSQSTRRSHVDPKPTRVVKDAFGPQTARVPSQSHSPLELTVGINYPYQIEEGQEAIIPEGNQTLPKKAKNHPTHPQQNSLGPQRSPVQQLSPIQRFLHLGFLRDQHLNHPPPKNQLIHTNSSQGILPQFNPTSGLKFELSKLKETATESNIKDVLPQFNPTSGLIFPLTESTNGTNTVHRDSEREINDTSIDLQPDPFHIVAGPSLHKHLANDSYKSDVITETSKIHKNNSHHESFGLFLGYEKNPNSPWKHTSSLKTANERLSFKAEENTTTPVPLINISDSVPISASNIKTTPPANSISSTTPVMSASSLHTAPEVAETAQEVTITSTSLTDSYKNNPPLMSAGFLKTRTELMMNSENQRSNNQPNDDENNKNFQDSHILSQARKGFVKPVPLDASDTTNTEAEKKMELGNTSTKSILIQNVKEMEENITEVLPQMPLFHSVVPSQKTFSSFDEEKHTVTEANNAAEAMVSSKANSQQQIHARPLYLQGFAQGLRQKPVLVQSIPPSQEPWKPLHDKPRTPATHFSSESPGLMVTIQPLLSEKTSSEINFSPSEAEILNSQNLPLSHRLSGLPPISQNTPIPSSPHDLALPSGQDWSLPPRSQDVLPLTQSQDSPLPPRLYGQPLPKKPQDVYLSLRLQKSPHPTRPQNLSQRQNNSASTLRRQVLPLSKRPQHLFSTPGPLYSTQISRPQNFQSDLLNSSLPNSPPPSTLLYEILGQQSQLSSQGYLPTRIKEKSPTKNLESSQDHKLPQTSQHTLFTTSSTTDQVHEPIIAAGIRHIKSESSGETLQRTQALSSGKLNITKLYKEPILSTPASHDLTFWHGISQPTVRPTFHRPSSFDSLIHFQSEPPDSLLVRQSDEKNIPGVQSTASVSLMPQVTSAAMTAPAANGHKLSSLRNDKLMSDILSALPDSLRDSVRVDRANLHNHNNVAVSNSYGNVIYQQGGITFIREENH